MKEEIIIEEGLTSVTRATAAFNAFAPVNVPALECTAVPHN